MAINLKKKEYILELCGSETGKKVLKDKIEEILADKDIKQYDCISQITDALLESEDGREIIRKHFKQISKEFSEDEYNDTCDNKNEDIKYLRFIRRLMEDENGYSFITKNMYDVLQRMQDLEVVDFVESLKPEDTLKVRERNEFLYKLYNKGTMLKDTLGILVKNDLNAFCEIIFDDLSEGNEITTLGEYGYSQVFKTNGYIIKIGKTRSRYEVPYHPKILQPLMKVRGIDDEGKNRYVIEVQNECRTGILKDEHVYKIKSELLKAGIKWTDDALENIGVTIVPNKSYLPTGTYKKPDSQNGSFEIPEIPKQETKPGEIVIIDADYIKYER